MSILDYFNAGGPIMYPIALCLIVALALTVERALFFLQTNFPTPDLERVRKQLMDANYEGALAALGNKIGPVPNILRRGIKTMSEYEFHHGRRIADFERFMKEAILQEGGNVFRNIRWLKFISQVAPLMGLLGTVVGLLDSFMMLAKVGRPEVSQLSGGIAVALITTVFGLLVAIPALLAREHFEGRAESVLADMERISVEMANAIMQARTSKPDEIPFGGVE